MEYLTYTRVLQFIPLLQLSGAGPTQYVQLVQQSEAAGQDQRQKKGESEPQAQAAVGPGEQSSTTPAEAGSGLPTLDPASLERTQSPQLKAKKTKAKTKDSPVKRSGSSASVDHIQQSQPELRFDEKERHRLCTETHRLLLFHREHAMTLAELVEYFRAGEDPAAPSTDELYECLKTDNTKTKGPTKGQKMFQARVHAYINGIPSDLRFANLCSFYYQCDLP